LNHRQIKKAVNKQIKLFGVKQAINLWAFPLGNKSIVLVINSCAQMLCIINTAMVEWQSMCRKI